LISQKKARKRDFVAYNNILSYNNKGLLIYLSLKMQRVKIQRVVLKPGDLFDPRKVYSPSEAILLEFKRAKMNEAAIEDENDNNNVGYNDYDGGDETLFFHGDVLDVGADASSNSSESESNESSEKSGDVENDPDVCIICGDSRRWKTLIECAVCKFYTHLGCCDPPMLEVPEDDFLCSLSCSQIYDDANKRSQVYDSLAMNELDNTIEGDQSGLVDESEDDLGCISRESARECDLITAGVALFRKKQSRPLLFASVCKWTREGRPITKMFFHSMLESIQEVLTAEKMALTKAQLSKLALHAPPENIPRVLRACGEGGVRLEVITHRFNNGVEATFYMSFRDPVAAAMDLYQSSYIKNRGPIYSWNTKHCDTGRNPKVRKLVKRFAEKFDFDPKDPSNLTLPVFLYSDETQSASGNVQFNPVWLNLATVDPDTRAMCGMDAHALVAFLPDKMSIEYRFTNSAKKTGQDAETLVTKSRKNTALHSLKKKALELLLGEWKKSECNGRQYSMGGKDVNVRIVLFNYVSDMKERRVHLDLKRNVYHCSSCYDFPGENNAEKLGQRSEKNDREIRANFKDERDLKTDTENEMVLFNQEHGKHGLRFDDECPFTSTSEAKIFTQNGPYALFRFDALHMKDGVINYYMKFLLTYLGEKFIDTTKEFGNIFLRTGRFSMHVMEKGIESFHFIPIALAFGQFEREITVTEREKLFMGSCDLLHILALLTDPCPKMVRNTLKGRIQSFRDHIGWLSKTIKDLDLQGGNETTKMHELFVHVVDQIDQAGLATGFSAKVYETFHEELKEMYGNTSHRRDGSAFREILFAHFHRMVILQVQSSLRTSSARVSPHDAWNPVSKFHISQIQGSKLSWPEQLEENALNVARILFLREEEEEVRHAMVLELGNPTKRFGNTLKFWLHCLHRLVDITPTRSLVVPSTSKGGYHSGGSFNAMAYRDPHSKSDQGISNCKEPNCRHHNRSFQLFCSAAREGDTVHGIPLLFLDNVAIVWRLERVALPSLQEHPIIIEYECNINSLEVVDFSLIRGACMMIPHKNSRSNRCFVITGRGVFGFN
jgi:hypothetical protein